MVKKAKTTNKRKTARREPTVRESLENMRVGNTHRRKLMGEDLYKQ